MITFLPYQNFRHSAMALDTPRLGKQRVEVRQLLVAIYWEELRARPMLAEAVLPDVTVLANPRSYAGIRAHPACKMWYDYPLGLLAYGMAVCLEWRERGYSDRVYRSLEQLAGLAETIYTEQAWMLANAPATLPPWLGDDRLHSSHRSNLIRKDRMRYADALGWRDGPGLPYFWPSEDPRYTEES